MQADKQFDTIILGSGISGTALASILAKQGFSVLLLRKALIRYLTLNYLNWQQLRKTKDIVESIQHSQ